MKKWGNLLCEMVFCLCEQDILLFFLPNILSAWQKSLPFIIENFSGKDRKLCTKCLFATKKMLATNWQF